MPLRITEPYKILDEQTLVETFNSNIIDVKFLKGFSVIASWTAGSEAVKTFVSGVEEVTTVTCPADVGEREVTTITPPIETAEKESTDITVPAGETGVAESTVLTVAGADSGVAEISSVDCELDAGVVEVTAITCDDGPEIATGDYFDISSVTVDYRVWFNVDTLGGAPSAGGKTLVEVAIVSPNSANQVATALATELDALGGFDAPAPGAAVITCTRSQVGAPLSVSSDGIMGGVFGAVDDGNGVNSDVNSTYFVIESMNGTLKSTKAWYVWFNVDGLGVDPAPGGTGIEVTLTGGASAADIAAAVKVQLDLETDDFDAVGISSHELTITNKHVGNVAATADGDTGWASIGNDTPGVDSDYNDEYFLFNTINAVSKAEKAYYAWCNVDGLGTDPAPGGTGVELVIPATSSANAIAAIIETALELLTDDIASANAVAADVTILNDKVGNVTDATVSSAVFSVVVTPGVDSDILDTYFTIESINDITKAAKPFYVWMNVDALGTDPAPAGTGVEIVVDEGDSANAIATAVAAALDALTDDFDAPAPGAAVVTATNVEFGNVTAAADTGSTGFTVTPDNAGADSIYNSNCILINSVNPTTKAEKAFHIWFNVGGRGVDPAETANAIEIELTYGSFTANDIATAIYDEFILSESADFTPVDNTGTVTITNTKIGNVAATADGSAAVAGMGLATDTPGVDSTIQSRYLTLSSPTSDYYAWFNVDGVGTDPVVAGASAIPVAITYGSQADTDVATALASAIDAEADFAASPTGADVEVTNADDGDATDMAEVGGSEFTIAVTPVGVSTTIDTVEDTATVTAHGLITGAKFALTTSAADLPSGLSATDYYAIVVDANTISFATSVANAIAGTKVDILDDGEGTHTITPVAVSGAIKIEGSNSDYSDLNNLPESPIWADIAGTSVAVSATGTHGWNISEVQYAYARVTYTATTGAGTISAEACAKDS